MQLSFCIASVHKQYLNSALVDRYFLDKFNQTSVFLNHTFILSTLKECKSRICKYCQHASKSRLQRAYERWAPTLLATNGLVKRDFVMATQLDAAFH
jgi:hypothetical protein